MYYQPDLSYSHRLFRYLLVASIVVHAGVLFYKKSGMNLALNSTNLLTSQSIQVQLRDFSQPKARTPNLPKKTIKKRATKKEVVKKTVVEEPLKQATNAAPSNRKNFKSFINNYVDPHYPRVAIRRGITGKVSLLLLVKGNGEIQEVKIAESSGHDILDNSALNAAKRWTFKRISPESDDLYKLSKTVVYKIN